MASSHPKVKIGERLYGYLAMTRYLNLSIASANNTNVFVSRPHLPKDYLPYNTLTRCSSDSMWKLQDEDATALWRPLFWTSFFMEDWLSTESYKGADVVLISSASSKTAFGLAYSILKKNEVGEPKKKIVGLTSSKNVEFTKNLKLYDQVFSYDELSKLDSKSGKWIYVDVAGNNQLNENIFQTFEKNKNPLVCGIGLGLTNSEQESNVKKRSMEFFFLPTWLAKRRLQLAPGEITRIQEKAWAHLMKDSKGWLRMQTTWKKDLVEKFQITASGKLGPEVGQTFSLWDSESQFNQTKLKRYDCLQQKEDKKRKKKKKKKKNEKQAKAKTGKTT
eukprot:TRINITY_DN5070_c0_g1_i2.p1 TRINITY_DN5070_c0_g1~~TRINITY_DN5070_c0_g1_i2.p1  ORF type:complete len:333 (-),score=124.09 TRINITY_DN5070_c0_g1_i2:39-1037(-)